MQTQATYNVVATFPFHSFSSFIFFYSPLSFFPIPSPSLLLPPSLSFSSLLPPPHLFFFFLFFSFHFLFFFRHRPPPSHLGLMEAVATFWACTTAANVVSRPLARSASSCSHVAPMDAANSAAMTGAPRPLWLGKGRLVLLRLLAKDERGNRSKQAAALLLLALKTRARLFVCKKEEKNKQRKKRKKRWKKEFSRAQSTK